METKLKEYADIQKRMKVDKARITVIKSEIEEELGQGDNTIKTEYATFKMTSRTSWAYSEATVRMEEDLKIQKEDEQEQKIATPTVAYSLRCNPKK